MKLILAILFWALMLPFIMFIVSVLVLLAFGGVDYLLAKKQQYYDKRWGG